MVFNRLQSEGTGNICTPFDLIPFSFLEPPVIAPFSFPPVVNTGVFAQLTCVVSQGDLPITISWSLKGQELNSGPSITTNMLGQRVSMLVIASVDYTHIGEYTCRATNDAGSVTHSAALNVNGNCPGLKGRALEISLVGSGIEQFD